MFFADDGLLQSSWNLPRCSAGETCLTSSVTDARQVNSDDNRRGTLAVCNNNMVTCLPLSHVPWTPGCLVRTHP